MSHGTAIAGAASRRAEADAAGTDGRRRRPFLSIGGRWLALLAISGLCGLSGVVAGTATPALADNNSFFVELAASPPTVAVGAYSTLTATTSSNVGPTPWFIDIYDMTTGTLLKSCGWGTTCSVNVIQGLETTHAYAAYVAMPNSTPPPSDIQGTSNTSYVTWTNSGLRVTLSGPEVDIVNTTGPATYTATSNVDVNTLPGSPSVIIIYDETTRSMVTFCTNTVANSCPMKLTPSVSGDFLVAFIEHYIQVTSQFYPPPLYSVEASSNVLLTRAFYG